MFRPIFEEKKKCSPQQSPTSSSRTAELACVSCSAPPRTTTRSRREWPQSGSLLLFYWVSWTDMNLTNLELHWERPGHSNICSAFPVTHCKRLSMQALAPAIQAQQERGTDSTTNYEETSSLWGASTEQLIRLIVLMKGWLTGQRAWCVHTWEVSFMLTLVWAQFLYTNSSAFPVKNVMNISTSWRQGAVTRQI